MGTWSDGSGQSIRPVLGVQNFILSRLGGLSRLGLLSLHTLLSSVLANVFPHISSYVSVL